MKIEWEKKRKEGERKQEGERYKEGNKECRKEEKKEGRGIKIDIGRKREREK